MKKRNEVIATILFCAIMTVGSFSVNAEQESQNEAGSSVSVLPVKKLTEKSVDENPFMAKGDTNIHHDCYNTDSTDEVLPWNMIDTGVRREHFLHEREMCYASALSPDCRRQCSACGAARLLKGGRCDG